MTDAVRSDGDGFCAVSVIFHSPAFADIPLGLSR
jgi:hypothetical protein